LLCARREGGVACTALHHFHPPIYRNLPHPQVAWIPGKTAKKLESECVKRSGFGWTWIQLTYWGIYRNIMVGRSVKIKRAITQNKEKVVSL
jgi:hypothetical protein